MWWCKSNNGKYPSSLRALGLGTLKEQQTHYKKSAQRRKRSCITRYANKSHALASTLARIIPIFYPGVTFSEYGCVVLQAGSGNYIKVREDGIGVTENDTDEVISNLKAHVPDKKHTKNVHYTIPVHNTTQMSYQMAVKHCRNSF